MRGRPCLIALEDIGSESILPLLEGVAAVALPVVDRGRPRRPSPRARLARTDRPNGTPSRASRACTDNSPVAPPPGVSRDAQHGAAPGRPAGTQRPRRLDQRQPLVRRQGRRLARAHRRCRERPRRAADTTSTSSLRSPSRTSAPASPSTAAEPPKTFALPSEVNNFRYDRRPVRHASRSSPPIGRRVRLPASVDPQPRRRTPLARARRAARRRVQRLGGLGRAALGPVAAVRAARRRGPRRCCCGTRTSS